MSQAKFLKRIGLGSIVRENSTSERSLRGIWLWLARALYLLTLAGVLFLFFIGTPSYQQAWKQGGAGLELGSAAHGGLLITAAGDEARQAGIVPGDILLAVNGTPIQPGQSASQVAALLTGPIGENLNLSIETANGSHLDVTIVRGGNFLQSLARLGLSLDLLVLFHIVLESALMLGFAVVSFLIFIRRSDDWFVILVALTQMLLPLTLAVAPQVAFGAQALHAFYFLEVIRMASLFPLVTMILLFPRGKLIPAWLNTAVVLAGLLTILNIANYLFNFFSAGMALLTGYWGWWFFFILGLGIQIYRFRNVYDRVERQQTKSIIIAFVVSMVVYFLYKESQLLTALNLSLLQVILLAMLRTLVLGADLLFFAVIMAFTVYHYRLWDTDFYINRTIIYGLLTAVMALVWTASMALLSYIFQQFTDKQSPLLAAVLSSIQVVALFQPVRDRIEKWVNARFYKDRIDFTEAIVELQPDRWQFITAEDMYDALAESAASLLHCDPSVVYLLNEQTMRVAATRGLPPAQARQLKIEEEVVRKLQSGRVIQLQDQHPFALLVPLVVPRGALNDLIGVLALGPRAEGRGYSRDHLADLSDLGYTAGTAIHFLQLYQRKLSRSA